MTAAPDHNAAFEHLEELLARLPQMTEKGGTLRKAKDARLLMRLNAELSAAEAEWQQLQEADVAAQAAYQAALANGDDSQMQSYLATVRYWQELIAVHRAPYQRAKTALDDALAASELNLGNPLAQIALAEDEFNALEAQVEEFKRDYAATLNECQQHQDGES
jgi:hypothetical protein